MKPSTTIHSPKLDQCCRLIGPHFVPSSHWLNLPCKHKEPGGERSLAFTSFTSAVIIQFDDATPPFGLLNNTEPLKLERIQDNTVVKASPARSFQSRFPLSFCHFHERSMLLTICYIFLFSVCHVLGFSSKLSNSNHVTFLFFRPPQIMPRYPLFTLWPSAYLHDFICTG